MHADLIPFVVLTAFSLVSAFLLRKASKVFAGLFIFAGLVPLVCAVSNSERWPVPFWLELIELYGSLPLLIAGCFYVGGKRVLSGASAIVFWISALCAIGAAAYIALIVFGLSNLP